MKRRSILREHGEGLGAHVRVRGWTRWTLPGTCSANAVGDVVTLGSGTQPEQNGGAGHGNGNGR